MTGVRSSGHSEAVRNGRGPRWLQGPCPRGGSGVPRRCAFGKRSPWSSGDAVVVRRSLTATTVAWLRETAAMLGEDIWIALKLPGEYEGDDDLEDGTAARRWTTVVLYPDELGWLRQALALNAEDEDRTTTMTSDARAAPGLPGT